MSRPAVSKQLHLNLFEMNTVGHISHGLWRHPENTRHRFNDLDFWTSHARLLEDGLFDAVFLADVVGTYDGYRGGPQTALREAVQIPSNDPLLVIPAMAAVTRHLGFVATSSTTYEPPFSFARRLSTLDHLTKGRVGWNVVTSYLPNAARNFGLAAEVDHDERYAVAEEYLQVVYALWEGSWDDDAVVADARGAVYTDPAKVRYVDHEGRYFSVAGPHLCEPSPQRTPVLFQAGTSEAGRAFAARHAEGVFVGGSDLAAHREVVSDLRRRAQEEGREPGDVKAFASASLVVGRTREEAQRKLEDFRRLSRAEGYLAHAGGGGIDLAAHPRDAVIDDILAAQRGGPEQTPSNRRHPPGTTVGQALDRLSRIDRGPFFAVGTAADVVDRIEEWVAATDLDGLNVRQFLTPGTAQDVVELVVPELQRRGLYRTRYEESTLRERLSPSTGPRLPERHPAARHRSGALVPAGTGVSTSTGPGASTS